MLRPDYHFDVPTLLNGLLSVLDLEHPAIGRVRRARIIVLHNATPQRTAVSNSAGTSTRTAPAARQSWEVECHMAWVQTRQAASHAHTATYACTCAAHTDRREAEGSTLPVWRGFLCTAVGSNGTQLCFHRPNRFFDDAIITPPPHGQPTPPDSDAPSDSSLALALAIASRFFRVISGAFFVAVRGAAALAFSR